MTDIWVGLQWLITACDRKEDDVNRMRHLKTKELFTPSARKILTACRAGEMTHQSWNKRAAWPTGPTAAKMHSKERKTKLLLFNWKWTNTPPLKQWEKHVSRAPQQPFPVLGGHTSCTVRGGLTTHLGCTSRTTEADLNVWLLPAWSKD